MTQYYIREKKKKKAQYYYELHVTQPKRNANSQSNPAQAGISHYIKTSGPILFYYYLQDLDIYNINILRNVIFVSNIFIANLKI